MELNLNFLAEFFKLNKKKRLLKNLFFEEVPHKKLELKLKNYDPKILAYIGDSVFELFVRTNSVLQGNIYDLGNLNVIKQKTVCCVAQSAFVDKINNILTQEEQKIFKWGRNAKQKCVPSSATKNEYRKATGLETLLGYLYLKSNANRIKEILSQLEF